MPGCLIRIRVNAFMKGCWADCVIHISPAPMQLASAFSLAIKLRGSVFRSMFRARALVLGVVSWGCEFRVAISD